MIVETEPLEDNVIESGHSGSSAVSETTEVQTEIFGTSGYVPLEQNSNQFSKYVALSLVFVIIIIVVIILFKKKYA